MFEAVIILANKRSGHHAIINWLCEQIDGEVHHHNDPKPKIFLEGIIKYTGKNNVTKYHVIKNNIGIVTPVYNFEDIGYDMVDKLLESKLLKDKKVLVLSIGRDYYNSIASVIKSGAKIDMEKYYKTWVSIVEHDFINYNKWFIDKPYRQKIIEDLGLKFTDKGFRKVSKFGDGSSFDKLTKQNASELDVLNRYKSYVTNTRWLSEINRPKIKEYNLEKFGIELI